MAKRYCGPCDRWLSIHGIECPYCGADTDPAIKPKRGECPTCEGDGFGKWGGNCVTCKGSGRTVRHEEQA